MIPWHIEACSLHSICRVILYSMSSSYITITKPKNLPKQLADHGGAHSAAS